MGVRAATPRRPLAAGCGGCAMHMAGSGLGGKPRSARLQSGALSQEHAARAAGEPPPGGCGCAAPLKGRPAPRAATQRQRAAQRVRRADGMGMQGCRTLGGGGGWWVGGGWVGGGWPAVA